MKAHPQRRVRKTRDAERTKRRILDAAEAVFAKAGVNGASTETIARRAGVSKTMLFYYFGNKEQLYIAVLRRLFDSVIDPARAQEIEKMEPQAALRTLITDYFRIHHERPTYAELTLREIMTYGGEHLQRLKYDLPIVGQLMRILTRGTLSGVFRPLDPLKTTLSIIGMTKILFAYREAMERVLEQEISSPQAFAAWREHLLDLLVNGVSACAPGNDAPPSMGDEREKGTTEPAGGVRA